MALINKLYEKAIEKSSRRNRSVKRVQNAVLRSVILGKDFKHNERCNYIIFQLAMFNSIHWVSRCTDIPEEQ